jgi:RHS repeat-associated protein
MSTISPKDSEWLTRKQLIDPKLKAAGWGGTNTFSSADNRVTSPNFSYSEGGITRGNLTANGPLTSYTYNQENFMLTAGASASYAYDAQGRRVRKNVSGTATEYFYSGSEIIAEKTGENWTDYIFFSDLRIAKQTGSTASSAVYFHSDHLGSIRASTDANGNATGTCDFEPFGEFQPGSTCTVSTNFRFAGAEYDAETGLYHFWFRRYDPNQGRWMGVDPIDGEAANPQSLDLYVYVLNDPVNLIDPFGLAVQLIGGRPINCTLDGISVDCSEAASFLSGGTFACPPELGAMCKDVAEGPPGQIWVYLPPTYFPQGIASGYKWYPERGWQFVIFTGSNFQEGLWRKINSNLLCDSPQCLAFLRGSGNFSSGFLDWWTLGFGSRLLGTRDVVDTESGLYTAGEVTGAAFTAAIGATAAAVQGGKYGSLFGRGGRVAGGRFNRGIIRFGWYWTGTRNAIGLRIGEGAGTWHIPFWDP